MARVLLLASMLSTIAGCGAGLSPTSQADLGSVLAQGVMYGGMALASAGRAPTDRVVTHDAPTGRELEQPDREYVCTSGDEETLGEETVVAARSADEARGECEATSCECVDRFMRDEVARYGARGDY